MAKLRGAESLTEELQQAASRLHEELTDGDGDFAMLTKLADQVGETADGLAATFAQLDQILLERVLGRGEGGQEDGGQSRSSRGGESQSGGGGRSRSQEGSRESESTHEELLERARKADIPGRSSMSRDKLQEALDEIEGTSKEELLERARELGISGRSGMTKPELLSAIRAEEQVSKEELLERAREAEIPGRSEMSKDELREALRSA